MKASFTEAQKAKGCRALALTCVTRWGTLEQCFDTLFESEAVEATYFKKIASARWDLINGNGHGVAYLLDPRYNGVGIVDEELKDRIEDFIVAFLPADGAESSQERREQMEDEYKKFQLFVIKQQEEQGRCYVRLIKKISVLEFWSIEGRQWPLLRHLARRSHPVLRLSEASQLKDLFTQNSEILCLEKVS
ncbi:hypothetical protein AC1031_001103 [Aphanomyces cochlioides]|nr:hypothetical protein AC1031_001103 [Aphanomyces cochlioides]